MALCIAVAAAGPGRPALAEDVAVDLELVLAIDTSQSVDMNESRLQRDGYVRALRDPEVIGAILSAPYGRIAFTYIEWAGPNQARVVMDWFLIDSKESALQASTVLRRSSVAGGQGTSISGAIEMAMPLFDGNGYDGMRRVIDISGDGPNSAGLNVTVARDAAVAAGIVINGAAINNFDGSPYTLPDLDVYYSECVIGGPGSFVVAVDGFESFAEAIRRKLVLEVAGLDPRVVPVASDGIVPVQSRQKYGPACDIGERMRMFGVP